MLIMISNNLFQNIICKPIGYNRETGGFVGINNNVIVEYVFDEGVVFSNIFTYRPDVKRFNEFIVMCKHKGIEKYGILHTHLNEEGTLSNSDGVFINNIFEVNHQIDEMYFPVIIPGKTMRIFKGKRTTNRVEIKECVISLSE